MAIETTIEHAGDASLAEIEFVDHFSVGDTEFAHKFIPPAGRAFLAAQRVVVIASRSKTKHIWCSLLTGSPGFLSAPTERSMSIIARPLLQDPLASNIRPGGAMALLAIDFFSEWLMTVEGEWETTTKGILAHAREAFVAHSKWIHRRKVTRDVPRTLPSFHHDIILDANLQAWIRQTDTFFIARQMPGGGLQAEHRSGRPGFVEVVDNQTIVFPECIDTAHGTSVNLASDRRGGLLFLNFENGDTLQVTGRARLIADPTWSAKAKGAQPAVTFAVESVICTENAIPWRWRLLRNATGNPSSQWPSKGTLH